MDTFEAIFKAFGGVSPLAKDLCVQYVTAQKWLQRDSIPPQYWIPLCEAAERRGIEGVTTETLSRITMRAA